jgi:Domain of unknown function (DUF2760)
MHRLAVAFRAFFRVLTNALVAEKVEQVLKGQALPAIEHQSVEKVMPKPEPKPVKKTAVRSDALKLLEALQREARLVDFFQEPLTGYEDAQIGAVVRDLHRQCAAALERMFALKPIEEAPEGAAAEVPAGFDPARVHLSGNLNGPPPFRGKLCHHGWEATRCELPAWSGSDRSLLVIAPAEIEVK